MLTSNQETRALQLVATHLGQVVWRQQGSEIFTEILLQLRRVVLSCSTCCQVVLRKLAADEYTLLNLLLRCMHPKVRSQTRAFFVDCLKFIRDKEPVLYGIEGVDHDNETDTSTSTDGLLAIVATRLRTLADETYMSTRGWDDYYLALNQIICMGNTETAVLLEHGILEFCARLFCMHTFKRFQDEAYELSRIMLGKRTGIFNRLIACMSGLILRTNINLPVLSGDQCLNRRATLDRECMKFPLTHREKQILLHWDSDLKAIAVLDKILEVFDQSKPDHFYPGDMVKWILDSTDLQIQTNMAKTIYEGLTLEPPFCDAYIKVSSAFCGSSPNPDHVAKVITAISKAVASANRIDEERAPSGDAVLDFFAGLLSIENNSLFEQRHSYIFYHWLMLRSRTYAIPLLLHSLESVRRRTQSFLADELYGNVGYAPEQTMQVKWKTIRDLVTEMSNRIVHEKDAGIFRSHLSPLIATSQVLIHMLFAMSKSEDPDMEQYKDPNDTALFYRYQTEVEARVRLWPDEGTPLSTGDLYDQSDYASESDDAQELLDH